LETYHKEESLKRITLIRAKAGARRQERINLAKEEMI